MYTHHVEFLWELHETTEDWWLIIASTSNKKYSEYVKIVPDGVVIVPGVLELYNQPHLLLPFAIFLSVYMFCSLSFCASYDEFLKINNEVIPPCFPHSPGFSLCL